MTHAATDRPAVDPMPAAALGMWLFVAAEAMFFAGLLSAYLVLQSTPAEHALFVRSAAVVSRPLTVLAIALLAASSAVIWRAPGRLGLVTGLAVAFLAAQGAAVERLLSHHTIVTSNFVYDGRLVAGEPLRIAGVRMPLPPTFDPSITMPADLRAAVASSDVVPLADVRADVAYGPSRNNYFGCYFLVTVAHAAHVVGGLIGLAWLAVRRRRRAATAAQERAVALYWQFVNGIGGLSIVLLALG